MTITPKERAHIRSDCTGVAYAVRLLDALEAAERERDETATNLVDERDAARAERDALQGIVDDIASETGHCLLLDDSEFEAPPLPDWVRDIVKERDALRVERDALAAAKETP